MGRVRQRSLRKEVERMKEKSKQKWRRRTEVEEDEAYEQKWRRLSMKINWRRWTEITY
jgi:hypothetical protein